MTEPSRIEQVRFGYGPRGSDALAAEPAPDGLDPDRVLAQLQMPDPPAEAYARPALADRLRLLAAARAERLGQNEGRAPDRRPAEALKQLEADDRRAWLLRAVAARAGFRERLVNFWANRLTVGSRKGDLAFLVAAYHDDVARSHLAGTFPDMLAASAFHPAMLHYLDQSRSVGPGSRVGRRRSSGLNENYARDLLALHRMGGRRYRPGDGTALARLLAGLGPTPDGAGGDPGRVEPGEKTVLGRRYGEGAREIRRFLADLAMRPETADSVATALAVHFLSDRPDPDLIARMAALYLTHDGALIPLYRALLRHPAASDPVPHKVRSPHEYVAASLRALDLSGSETTPSGPLRRGWRAEAAMKDMGQPVFAPPGPDGWPEVSAEWISPPFLSARLDWAERLGRFTEDRVEPVALARHLIGPQDAQGTIAAVAQAERRWEGVAVLLGAPAFMRR